MHTYFGESDAVLAFAWRKAGQSKTIMPASLHATSDRTGFFLHLLMGKQCFSKGTISNTNATVFVDCLKPATHPTICARAPVPLGSRAPIHRHAA